MIIPSEYEIKIIKEMILENESYRSIGKKLNMSGKTVTRIVKDYNIDISNYNPRIANGKSRIKKLDTETLNDIVKLLEQGYSIRQIIMNYKFISRPTLERILKDNNIDPKKYKKISKRRFVMSNKQIEQAKEDLANNKTIKEIAKQNNVTRDVCSQYLKSIGLINDIDTNITNEVKNFIIKMHSRFITISNINIITNVNKNTIKDIINKSNINITERMKYKQNIRNNANSTENLLLCLNEFNKLSNKQIVRYSDVKYILDNIEEKNFLELIKELKCDYQNTKRLLKLLKLDYIFYFENMKTYKYFDEFVKDMSILSNSNVALAKKYGPSYTSISDWRKNIYGEMKSYYRVNLSRSNFEIDMELLLNELDIAFIKEYIVNNLSYDFYLGHNILIELNGSYWHKNNEKADIKKINNVKDKYDLLVIDENEFYSNKTKFRNMILKLYIKNVCKQYNLAKI